MTAITLTDLANAKLDVDHIATLATSSALTATDRLGNTKRTMAGALDEYPNAFANSEAAADSAAAALVSEGNAGASEAAALAAKVAVEAARDAANAVSKVFTTVALGIAGTTSGQSFSVLSGDTQDIIVYTNPSTTEVFRLKTKAFFDTVFSNGFTASRTGYLYAWVDSSGELLLGIKNDGTLWSKGADLTTGVDSGVTALATANALNTATAPAVATVIAGPDRGDYLYVFTDSADRIIGGFLNNGEFEVKGVNLSSSIAALSAFLPFVSTPTTIYAWGDSLTENGTAAGGWILTLAAALGRTVTKGGYGGQNAQKIIGLQGSYLVTVTVTGNQIPASGPVNVTVVNAILDTSGTVATKLCSINGVAGTLSKSGAQYVFTRTTAGSAVTVWPGTTLEVTKIAEAAFATNIIWVGRNHFNYAQTVDQYNAQIVIVLDAVDKAFQSLNPLNRRAMIVGVTNGSTEAIGSDGYNAILSCNAQLQAKYPQQFLDIRTVLLNSGTGAGADATDYANGVIPTSLRSDTQHLSAAGEAVVATAFQSKLSYLGI